ncbi:peptidoglycan DD-metalloendopeptidase family protein [Granulicatella sp. zg-ZJ]|uniref:murein hydrolase activator EnvC family protein n=1 Tax=unclassified Granulicatella TaxID=2630493 RepID=UPI0013C0E05A|nr:MULTISPECIES: peptidoglycan DD-metalloendopeptidase family protein [unclassified Granulicatella]MBS4749863.1 peptidoglycan DD-metalloendopeptidase family protein [Carnobacteriaceae bacterium zg-ZUI78]NEW63049.1 peptidoglycan DD-metalloendopeptidase family protein [Granulicatella sp. zg-ZJ]NEW66946.1 peptidoglycan DD-metalloendopeptidase family protein [Granulicatella sp. zg-84]QMI85958.1 peptidoglycan DD-metalloendopeptidase family protein [Carnobacteriaceae bacterium zg-84]
MHKHYKLCAIFCMSALLCQVVIPVAFADEYDTKISQQKEKIKEIDATTLEKSSELKQTMQEIEMLENTIHDVEKKIEDNQKEFQRLQEESALLEELIIKRDERIKEQARHIQVDDTTDDFFQSILASENIVEALSKVLALTELTRASNDILEQQRIDKDKLNEKREKLEQITLEDAQRVKELDVLKSNLLIKTTEIEVALSQLASDKQDLETDIEKTKEKQEQAKREYEELKRREQDRQEALKKEQERIQQIALAKSTVINTGQTGFVYPISQPTVTSPFGVARQLTLLNGQKYTDVHNGIDYVNGNSQALITASAGGVVVFAGKDSYGGIGVIIKHENGMYTHYWHLSTLQVSVGQSVSQGQALGVIGATGLATGIHLHFGMSTQMYSGYVNPALYVH